MRLSATRQGLRRVPEVSEVPLVRLPYVEGVLSAVEIADTAASIAAMQEPCGAIPWTVGEHVDIWNHVEAAMAMLVGGQVEAAERAYEWVPTMQRADGSWPMKIVGGVADDERGEVLRRLADAGLQHLDGVAAAPLGRTLDLKSRMEVESAGAVAPPPAVTPTACLAVSHSGRMSSGPSMR
mgnify:CR=1 FL=1